MILLNKPLKKFGQNYLIDNNTIKKIIAEINPQRDDNIIEIGPGRGALTKLLVDKSNNFTAIEIDTRVIESLKASLPSLKIVNADFLKLDLEKYSSEKSIKVVGNIPYNITSSIIFKMIENRNCVREAILMVQYEVAKRMNGSMGTKDYGILSVLLNIFGEVKFCFKVSPNVFRPKPNVESAIVHINFRQNKSNIDDKLIIKLVKASFGNRRKILKNSLSNSIFVNYDFSDSGIDLNKRAEELRPEDFIKLASNLKHYDSK